jgi:hypothetical protein
MSRSFFFFFFFFFGGAHELTGHALPVRCLEPALAKAEWTDGHAIPTSIASNFRLGTCLLRPGGNIGMPITCT